MGAAKAGEAVAATRAKKTAEVVCMMIKVALGGKKL